MAIESDILADLNESESPVKSRISDPSHAQAIANRLVKDDQERAKRRVRVEGLLGGNPPVNPEKLRRAGRANDSNVNWRGAKGQMLNAWTPYFDLVTEVPVCVEGTLEFSESSAKDAELMRGYAEAFHNLVFGWTGYDKLTQLRDWQGLLHGVGIVRFKDEWDWRPETIKHGSFYVSDDTDADLDNAEVAVITTSMNISQLWRTIRNEKQAVAAGWKPEAVKKSIMGAGRGDTFRQYKWDSWQKALTNGDLYVSQTQTKIVHIYIVLVMEMDGTISQHIVEQGKEANGFLFSKTGVFKNWDEACISFPFDIGMDGTYHSVKGLGTEIYARYELDNRIKNSLADLVVTSIKPMFQPTSGTSAEGFQMVYMGGFNILPPNMKEVPVNLAGNIQHALAISQAFDSDTQRNTGAFHQDSAPATVEETAKAVMIRAAERAKLNKGAHNRHYRCLDRMYREMWRRATSPNLKEWHPGAKQALEFQAECAKISKNLGVDPKALQAVKNIRAYRSIGLGSAAMRIEIANAVKELYPLLDPVGQNNAIRMYIAALTSFHSVDALMPSLESGRELVDQDWQANAENNDMDGGGTALVTARQEHGLHLKHHVPSMEQDATACEQGQMEQRECFKRLEVKGIHSQEHITRLSANPLRKQEADEYAQRLGKLAAYQDHLKQNIEEQDAANPQEEPSKPSPEMVKVQGNLALKSQKQQGDMALKEQKMAHDAQLKEMQARHDAELKAAQARADIAIKDATAASSINRTAQ